MTELLKKSLNSLKLATLEKKQLKLVILALFLGAILRAAYSITYGWDQNLLSDYFWYRSIAQDIIHVRPLVDPYTQQDSALHPPAFAFFLAFLDIFSLNTTHQQLIIFILLNCLIMLAVFEFCARLLSNDIAILATFIAAIDPRLIFIDAIILPQPFFIFVGIICLTVALSIIKEGWLTKKGVFLGILLGITVLTRTDGAIFGIILTYYVTKTISLNNLDAIKKALIIILCALVVIVPWAIRNAVDLNSFIPVSTSVGTILSQNNCEISYYDIKSMGIKSSLCGNVLLGNKHLNETQYNQQLINKAFNYITHHLSRYFLVAIVRVLRPYGLYHPIGEIQISNISGYSDFRKGSFLFNLNIAILWITFVFDWVLFCCSYIGYQMLKILKKNTTIIFLPLIYCLLIMFFINSGIETSSFAELSLIVLTSVFLYGIKNYFQKHRSAVLDQHQRHESVFQKILQLKSE
jgi:4-amino-4-deoxy-L-arabinose transferase-like glycosyltransferase